MWGPFFISGRDWIFPAAAILLVACFLLLLGYRRKPVSAGWRAFCFALKLAGFAALAFCLLEPQWSRQRARPGANFFALVADNSQSIQIKNRNGAQTRAAFLRESLKTVKNGWQEKLDEQFQVRRYLFDVRLQSIADFNELSFDGRASSMLTSLRSLRDRFKGQPLAGVLLFTDGNATDAATETSDFAGLPPVYPVILGTEEPVRDLSVQGVTVTETSFEDAPVTVLADVTADGFAGESLVAQLVEVPSAHSWKRATNAVAKPGGGAEKTTEPSQTASGEKVIAELTERAPKDGEHLTLRFQVRPEKTGVLYYRVRVAPKREGFAAGDASSEATLANNQRWVVVDRGRGPYRVLYVSGRPNWEFKFLNRAVADDDQVQLVGLIRVARREPKFEFRTRPGESSNPLFRGFDRKTEETERYDKPVLVRLNTRDEVELRGGFPKTPEELYQYHAVILDDLEAEFFSPDQMALLQKFVSERGGGFLMLGGQESFAQGHYLRTLIGDMLPVYLDQPPEPVSGELKLTLTREGWLQPWARLRPIEVDEKVRLDAMPPFRILNRVRAIKPGASVVATVGDGARQYPAVVVQRFGSGRTAALTIGDWWLAGLQNEQASKDLAKSWRQMIRWLVSDVPNRIELQTEYTRSDPNDPVVLQVRARDRKFQALDNASVKVTVRPVTQPGKTATNAFIELTADPVPGEPGMYRTSYIPRENGGYHAEAVVTGSEGPDSGHSAMGWASDLSAEEFRSLKPNRSLLESIAKKTGGEVIEAGKLEAFIASLPQRKVPVMESWSFPLWHTAAMFLFAFACFITEWGIRRWKGLA